MVTIHTPMTKRAPTGSACHILGQCDDEANKEHVQRVFLSPKIVQSLSVHLGGLKPCHALDIALNLRHTLLHCLAAVLCRQQSDCAQACFERNVTTRSHQWWKAVT